MQHEYIKKIISIVCVFMVMGAVLLLAMSDRDTPGADRTIVIGVSLYDEYDAFLSQMMDCFNANVACKQEEGTSVSILRYDAAKSQNKQNENVKEMIADGCDVICVNLVDRTAPATIIDMARKNDVPIIFFNRELVEEDLQQWDRLYYVGADAEESGRMQGELAAQAVQALPHGDYEKKIRYVILEGEAGHQDAIVRTEVSVSTMISKGVILDKVGYGIANWNRAQACSRMEQLFETSGKDIDLVLANNDEMALGAIDACENLGIAQSDRPLILGIDGTDMGLAAVASGKMYGTVYNDKEGQAKVLLELSIAIAGNEDLSRFRLTDGKYIRLPYAKVTEKNIHQFLKTE